jgi:hypothetical protein
MICKISPAPSLPSGPEALWAGGQRGEKKKRKMPHSITRRAEKLKYEMGSSYKGLTVFKRKELIRKKFELP